MMPRLARALVNISLVCPGERLLDPFSGTGGILLEASLVGAHATGSDIDPCMVSGSRENVPGADLVRADTGALPFRDASIDAVVTDLPYGQSSSIIAGSLEGLYSSALSESGVFSCLERERWWSPTGIFQGRPRRFCR